MDTQSYMNGEAGTAQWLSALLAPRILAEPQGVGF